MPMSAKLKHRRRPSLLRPRASTAVVTKYLHLLLLLSLPSCYPVLACRCFGASPLNWDSCLPAGVAASLNQPSDGQPTAQNSKKEGAPSLQRQQAQHYDTRYSSISRFPRPVFFPFACSSKIPISLPCIPYPSLGPRTHNTYRRCSSSRLWPCLSGR